MHSVGRSRLVACRRFIRFLSLSLIFFFFYVVSGMFYYYYYYYCYYFVFGSECF